MSNGGRNEIGRFFKAILVYAVEITGYSLSLIYIFVGGVFAFSSLLAGSGAELGLRVFGATIRLLIFSPNKETLDQRDVVFAGMVGLFLFSLVYETVVRILKSIGLHLPPWLSPLNIFRILVMGSFVSLVVFMQIRTSHPPNLMGSVLVIGLLGTMAYKIALFTNKLVKHLGNK